MFFSTPPSRRQFRDYLLRLVQARKKPPAPPDEKESAHARHPHDRGGGSKFRHRSAWTLLKQFLRLLKPQRKIMLVAMTTLTLSTFVKLVPPAATKFSVDYVLAAQPLPESLAAYFPGEGGRYRLLVALAAGVVVLSLGESLMHLWGRWYATLATKRLQCNVRRRAFEHAADLPLHRAYQLKSGGLTSIVRDDAAGVGDLVFNLLYNPWRALIQFAGSLVVLAWVDLRLLAGALILVPLIFVTHRTWINRIRPMHREIRKQRQEIDGHATEAFGGMRIVRAFGRKRSESGRFMRGNYLMTRQELHAWWWARGVELFWEIVVPVASAALLIYGGFQVLGGGLTMGDLMMFLVYLTMLLGPLATLATSATSLQTNLAGLDRILDLLEEPSEFPIVPDTQKIVRSQVRGKIRFDNVSFRYPKGERNVLEHITLDVPAGTVTALVGPSGAGKTTFCNLVARFYDPTQGTITLDGVDLKKLSIDDYRSLLGIVDQEVFLFDGTVGDNIAYARRHAAHGDILRAADIAHAHEFISALENGYDTLIGERGVRLSGGQRQRIAIARAVLADPKILILDEATSNLDTRSERLIQESLKELMRGRTSFVIAHRLSTIAHADQIVLLEAGRITDAGPHARLMAENETYRTMVRLQTGWENERNFTVTG